MHGYVILLHEVVDSLYWNHVSLVFPHIICPCFRSMKSLLKSWLNIRGYFFGRIKTCRGNITWRKGKYFLSKSVLGVKYLRKQNITLVVKWLWKLESLDGLWQRIVKEKISAHSPSWKAILKVEEIYFDRRKFLIHNHDIVGKMCGLIMFLYLRKILCYMIFVKNLMWLSKRTQNNFFGSF